MGCCTGSVRGCGGGISRSGSGRGRRSASVMVAGRRTGPGRCCCRRCRPPRPPPGGSTGTCPWTPRRCVPTSTPPARRRRAETSPAAVSQGGRPRTNQVDPVLGKLAVRLEGVVSSASVRELPRRFHHQGPPRTRRTMLATCRPPDTWTLRRRSPAAACPGAGVGAPHRSRPASHPTGPGPGRQGLHVLRESPLPATTRRIAHHPRTARPPQVPPEPPFPRRSAHRVRPRALRETQHRRACHQPPESLPRRRHTLRETGLHLPRHHHPRRTHSSGSAHDPRNSAQAAASAIRTTTGSPADKWPEHEVLTE